MPRRFFRDLVAEFRPDAQHRPTARTSEFACAPAPGRCREGLVSVSLSRTVANRSAI